MSHSPPSDDDEITQQEKRIADFLSNPKAHAPALKLEDFRRFLLTPYNDEDVAFIKFSEMAQRLRHYPTKRSLYIQVLTEDLLGAFESTLNLTTPNAAIKRTRNLFLHTPREVTKEDWEQVLFYTVTRAMRAALDKKRTDEQLARFFLFLKSIPPLEEQFERVWERLREGAVEAYQKDIPDIFSFMKRIEIIMARRGRNQIPPPSGPL